MERNPSQLESGYLKSKCNLQLLDKIEIFDNKYKNKNEKVIQNLGLFFV